MLAGRPGSRHTLRQPAAKQRSVKASTGCATASGVSGGGHALGGGCEGPFSGAGGGRGGAYTRTDDAERFTLGTLSLALQFLFRVRGKLVPAPAD